MSRHHYYKMLSEEDKRTFNQWARVSLTVWMMGLAALVAIAVVSAQWSKTSPLDEPAEAALLQDRP